MKDEYPDVKQDLYGAFVVRGIELAGDSGLLAIVVGDAWMSLKSFEALRLHLQDGHSFNSLLHLRDVAYHAESFGANAAFVLSINGDPFRPGPFVRLTSLGSDRKARDLRHALAERTEQSGFHLAASADFSAIPGSPIVYWLSENMRAAFAKNRTIGDIATLRQGLKTADNDRFLRRWSEVSLARTAHGITDHASAVSSCARWFPYNKGGEFRRWYGNQEFVVNWAEGGEELRTRGTENGGRPLARVQATEFYFLPSVSWPEVSSGIASFRAFPQGFIFDSTGSSAFITSTLARLGILAVANSSAVTALLAVLAPGLRFDVGQVAKLPVPDSELIESIGGRADDLVETAHEDWDSSEFSWSFAQNPVVALARGLDEVR